MTELIPVTFFSFLFAAISHQMSGYDQINGTYERKERLFYYLTAITLILFCGLRTSYNDTYTYRGIYQWQQENIVAMGTDIFKDIEWLKIGDNPGFYAIMRVMAKLGFSIQTFTMIFAIFTVGVNIWFFRKYSYHFFISILIYVTFAGYIFTLAAIKQCAAMAIGLLATDRAIRKKYVGFLAFILVACTIHPYALMYLVVPFLFFRPWSKSTIFMLIFFGVLGVSMQSLVGTVLNVTDMLGESYDAKTFTGEGVNPIRLLVTAVPVGLSLLNEKTIRKNEEKDQYAMVNLTMLNAEIMFVALFGTANFFARLANYFIPFQAVSLPWLFKQFDFESKRTITVLASAGYLLFFVFSFSINENFDWNYNSMPLMEYIKSLFGGIF